MALNMVTMLNSIGTTSSLTSYVISMIVSKYIQAKKENKKRHSPRKVSVYVINYYFVAIKASFVSCEQEPVIPVICVSSRHLSYSVGFAFISIVPVRS